MGTDRQFMDTMAIDRLEDDEFDIEDDADPILAMFGVE